MKPRAGTEPRVARVRRLRRAAVAALAVAALAVAGAFALGYPILRWLDRRAAESRLSVSRAFRKVHGLAFYAPLDERAPEDAVTRFPLVGTAAVRVPGVFGKARRFDGRPGENLVSTHRWGPFARTGLTLALWMRLPQGATNRESRLVWDHDANGTIGLRMREGRLEAAFSDAGGVRLLSAPAPAPERFAHVAFVVGSDRVALFVDGALASESAVSGPLSFPGHPAAIGTDGHFPPVFDVDEWCVFNRPLDDAEVARIVSSRRPVADLLEPRRSARARRHTAQANAFRSFLGAFGFLRPARVSPAVFNRSIPTLELRLSRADRRHFRKAHLEAVASGFRTRDGARARRVRASFRGRTEDVRAWLDESVFAPPLSARPAFVLVAEGDLLGGASGLARLFPPEQYGARLPDAAFPLPLAPERLVRLHLDGDFLGLYCLVPFETPAPPWFATGLRDINRPDRLHFAAPAGAPMAGAGFSPEERDAAWRRSVSLFGSDPNFPLSPAEVRLLARRHAKTREFFLFPDPEPGPETILGANPAAFYVTNDLDLAAAGPGLAWRSSDPATISPEGRVSRPDDGRPRVVELSADLPGGGVRTHRLRVMPTAPALPALLLSFGRPLDKLARTDFVCLRIPAGADAEPSWLSGTGPTGGGAKLRGNTSFVTGRRRPINLEFDRPVDFPGAPEPVDHLLLLSGYADPTRLRNALSFDTFRAMSPEGTVRATAVLWTEVFVNGAYAGVWECCPRLQDVLSESFDALYKVRSSYGLWTDPDNSAEDVDRVGAGGKEEKDPYAPMRELTRLVARVRSEDEGDDPAGSFDLDELVDFYLLVNFTGNQDGRVTNQFVGRRAEDGLWMILPWDYDKTFLVPPAGVGVRTAPIVSPLYERLFRETPGFRERVAARWRELRAGLLSEASLDAWIDERAALLGPYMDEDYRVVPPLGHDGDFADAVAALRAEVRFRLSLVDGFLAGP